MFGKHVVTGLEWMFTFLGMDISIHILNVFRHYSDTLAINHNLNHYLAEVHGSRVQLVQGMCQ